MYILGIESSCDDTSAAVVEDGRKVLSNIVSSQTETHRKFGGVVPEIASRKHIENISGVIDAAIKASGAELDDMSAVAVTFGPGLVGALLVGVAYAKALAYALNKPLIGVHHIEGHINAVFIDNPELLPGFISLVVSGGHTQLVKVRDYGEYTVLGRTRDDAAGEAYDKVARALGLSYPGGPAIEQLAREGNPRSIDFPRALLEPGTYDFSFSGLKSAVLNYLNKNRMTGEPVNPADVAASFQQAVLDVLVGKAMDACKQSGVSTLALAGGVSCNSALRKEMQTACNQNGLRLYVPEAVYCTDNAAMTAVAGYHKFLKNQFSGLDLNAYPSLAM